MLKTQEITDLSKLIKQLEDLSQKAESGDDIDIQAIMKQMETADKVMDVIDEKTDQLLSRMDAILSELEQNEVDEIVGKAVKANQKWSLIPIHKRQEMMLLLADKMTCNLQELAELESRGGKPITQAKEDIIASIDVFRYFAQLKVEFTKSYEIGKTIRQPIGTVVLMAWKVAPCLVAGNTVVIKPAPMTPHSTSRICELSRDIFPNDVIQVIEGKSDVGGQLVQHPLVKMISFTGSTRVGQSIAIECAKQLKPCTLELGGKNGCVVFDDVDVNQVVDIVLDGAFSNMGQNCCAISRLFLHENIHDFFMQVFIEKASKLVVGHASDPKTDIGPVISREAFDSISSMISKAKKDGLKIALGGSDEESNIIYPTVIQEVPDDHIVAQQEIFGPVLCIMKPFKTVEQVIDRVNDSPYGLACGIFTKNKEILDQMTVKIEAGMIWHNTYNIVPPHLPFGGLKKSGLGKDLGLESVYSFTIQKSIYP